MPNLKLVIEYDGARYHGWQRQPNISTIQGTLEEVISRIVKKRTTVIGAGRTDAGVHAEGQVANFKTRAGLKTEEWLRALNSLLPEDIVIRNVEEARSGFHARFSAVGKTYRYRIVNRRFSPAIGRQYVWTVYSPLNISRMRSAAKSLVGRRDFSSFQGSDPSRDRDGKPGRTSICHIRRLELSVRGQEITFTIEADRFLQHMVRSIVGTLVEVGKGRRSPAEMRSLLQKKDRRFGGATAPPQGLCLLQVFYE